MNPRLPRLIPSSGTPRSATRLAPRRKVPSPPRTTRASTLSPSRSRATRVAPGSSGPSSCETTTGQPRAARRLASSIATRTASGLPGLSRNPNRMRPDYRGGTLLVSRGLWNPPGRASGGFVEERDAQAVELAIRALSDHLVDDLRLRIVSDPAGEHLTQLVAI